MLLQATLIKFTGSNSLPPKRHERRGNMHKTLSPIPNIGKKTLGLGILLSYVAPQGPVFRRQTDRQRYRKAENWPKFQKVRFRCPTEVGVGSMNPGE